MIEKYFMLGVRLKWACPASDSSGIKDGSIVDNPLRPSNMTYDGMDGQLYNLAGPHVSTVGLTMRMNIPIAGWSTNSDTPPSSARPAIS